VFSVVELVINAPNHAGGLTAHLQTHCWTKGEGKGGEVTMEKDRERVRDAECGEGKGTDVSAS